MMERLLARARAIASSEQLRRLQRIAATIQGHGVRAEIADDAVTCSGNGLAAKWLGEPLLRFVGRAR